MFGQDRITKSDIINKVYAPNGYDGLRADADLQALVHEESRRAFSKKLLLFSAGGVGFSLFNCMRLGRLSASGRTAAVSGLAFFSFLTAQTLHDSRLLVTTDRAPTEDSQKKE